MKKENEIQKDYMFDTGPLFDDLYEKEFDLTWQKYLKSKNEIYSVLPIERYDGPDYGDIEYKYNSDGFRSDNFTTNHIGKHILFSGCSETEGVGGNIEDTWSKILYNKISLEEKCSGFFNLARSGWGWSRIVLNAMLYFQKYGYPDVYFILLPNNQRHFYYNEQDKNWMYWQKYPEYYKDSSTYKDRELHSSTPKEYLEDYVKFLISWKLFIGLCESNGVKIIFSTWDKQDEKNLKLSEPFKNYVDLNKNKIPKYTYEFYKNRNQKDDDFVKRDGHSGRIFHNFWADEFYNEYKRRSR